MSLTPSDVLDSEEAPRFNFHSVRDLRSSDFSRLFGAESLGYTSVSRRNTNRSDGKDPIDGGPVYEDPVFGCIRPGTYRDSCSPPPCFMGLGGGLWRRVFFTDFGSIFGSDLRLYRFSRTGEDILHPQTSRISSPTSPK